VIVEFAFEGLELRRFHAHKGGVTCLAMAKGELITGGCDGHVRIWSRETLDCRAQLVAPGNRVRSLIVDDDEKEIWAGSTNDKTLAWRLDGTPFARAEGLTDARPVAPDGFDEVSAFVEGKRLTWIAGRGAQRAGLLASVERAEPTRTMRWRLPYSAACLAFSRDERTLYAGGNGRLFAIDLPIV
jgi:hypothetical protein